MDPSSHSPDLVWALAFDFLLQLRPGEGPMPVHHARSHFQCLGNFSNRHADEITQLDYLGGQRVFGRERVQRIVPSEDFLGGNTP